VDWESLSPKGDRTGHRVLLEGEPLRAAQAGYFGLIEQLDDEIAPLVEEFKTRSKRAGRPWLIWVIADHGEMLGDHGVMAKMNFYRSSVRVPLIVRPLGGTAGRVETAPVQALDVPATLLDAGAATALDGAPSRSLVPLVTGRDGATRDHVASMIRMRPDLPTWQAITDGRWRATINADTGEAIELFDLAEDPDEATNRVGDPDADAALVGLTTALASTIGTA
jgi:arylsulfatase A-like enzyme